MNRRKEALKGEKAVVKFCSLGRKERVLRGDEKLISFDNPNRKKITDLTQPN